MRSRRSRYAVVTWVILGVGTAVIVFAGLFVVPVSHTFSFQIAPAACLLGARTWSLPDQSSVHGSWVTTQGGSTTVVISEPSGARVYDGAGSSGSFQFMAVGTPYTIEVGWGAAHVVPGCVVVPTTAFSGTFTGPLL